MNAIANTWTFDDTLLTIGYLELCYVRKAKCTIRLGMQNMLDRLRAFWHNCIGTDPTPCEICPLRPRQKFSPVLLELSSALSSILWGVWMMYTEQPEFNKYGQTLITPASLDLWGFVLIALGCFQLFAEVNSTHILRKHACFLMALSWSALAWGFLFTRPAALLFIVQFFCQALRYLQLARGAPGNATH